MPRQPWLTMINFFNSRDQNEIKSACIGTTIDGLKCRE